MLLPQFPHPWRRTSKLLKVLLFFASFAAVLLLGSSSPLIAQAPPSEIRGVWLTGNDTEVLTDRPKLQEAISQLAKLNFTTLYPVVWNSGYVLYPSAIATRMGIQPFVRKGLEGQDVLEDLITQAHHQHLKVMPWFEFGFMAPPLSELTTAHPDWLTQQQDGTQTWNSAAGEVVWLNPFRPEVQQFITDLVLETISQYDVDGIQFDDHASLPAAFGYDSYTLALYKQETKKDAPSDPKDPEWMRWRADKLTTFISQLRKAIKGKKPAITFSISPTTYHTAYNSFLQDWVDWVRKDIADEVIVQIYRPELQSFVGEINKPEIQEVLQKVPTAAGILTGLRTKPVPMSIVAEKVQAAREKGLGVSFFFYESLWDVAPEPALERQAAFQAVFALPLSSPAFHSTGLEPPAAN